MHYSNWLIGVKNRASLRNAYKTPPKTDWNNKGTVVDVKNNNNPRPNNEKTSEHLWKKGKDLNEKRRGGSNRRQISRPAANYFLLDWHFLIMVSCVSVFNTEYSEFSGRAGVIYPYKHTVTHTQVSARVSSFLSGQSGGRRRAPLPRRRSANSQGSIGAKASTAAPVKASNVRFDTPAR